MKTPDLEGMEGPGVAPKSIPVIDQAAEKYKKARDSRIAASAKETEAKGGLIALLHEHEKEIGKDDEGVIRYKYDESIVTLTPTKESLKVRSIDDEEEE